MGQVSDRLVYDSQSRKRATEKGKHIPNTFLLAIRTTVSLIPRSLVILFLSAISADSSASFFLSSDSRSGWGGSRGDRGRCDGGDSYSLVKSTNTDGIRAVCFLTHIGAMRPSG